MDKYKAAKNNLDGIFDYVWIIKNGQLLDLLFKCFLEYSEKVLHKEYYEKTNNNFV